MKHLLVCLSFMTLLISCSKDQPAPNPAPKVGNVSFQLSYNVDGTPLTMDSLCNFNAAGNHYEVTRLQFILSNFKFHRSDDMVYADRKAYYLDCRDVTFDGFTIDSIPPGTYTSFSFSLGLDSTMNKTGALPNTPEFVDMAWPDPMGGGYHFMKLEGHFEDVLSFPGFNMHLGMNECRVDFDFTQSFTIDNNTQSFNLAMNVNEWFEHPSVYDFNVDPCYTMGNMDAMMKLAMNGADIFTLMTK